MKVYTLLFAAFVGANCSTGDQVISERKQKLYLEEVKLNNSKQWISLSDDGAEMEKPVLLFLHGGPGSANLALLHQLVPRIEDHAVVVNWDQRGAGKSYHLSKSDKPLNTGQLVHDAHILTQYLKQKFNKDKIILMGFSAGTAIGIQLASIYPEDYSAFISIAQMVDGRRGELLSLDFTLKEAKQRNDKKAVKALEEINFDFSDPENVLKNTQKQRKYLLKYGGVYREYDGYGHEAKSLWQAKEYGVIDFLFWPRASQKSLQAMWHEVVLHNFIEEVSEIKIPIIFMSGVYDMNNPVSLVKEYFGVLNAPAGKQLIIFEGSAHAVFWDEPEKFENEVIAVVKSLEFR